MNTALQVAQWQAAAAAGQIMKLRNQEGVDLPGVVEAEKRRRRHWRIEFVKTAPVDDPIAGQRFHVPGHSRRTRCCRGYATEDNPGKTCESEFQLQSRCRQAAGSEDAIVAIDLTYHAVAEPVGCRREFDGHVRHFLESVELPSFVQDPRNDAGFGDPLNPIVQHHPLIMPGYLFAGLGEELA